MSVTAIAFRRWRRHLANRHDNITLTSNRGRYHMSDDRQWRKGEI